MQIHKQHYFIIYRYSIKLLALLVLSFLFVSCNKKETQQNLTPENQVKAENAVNINTATAAELEKLPNIGAKLAQNIIEYRENYGAFRRAEHLILVPGISDKRFREMQNLIKVE